MRAVDELIARPAFAYGEETDRLFHRAMRETFEQHWRHCRPYRRYCEHLGFGPEDLRSVDDVPHVPALFVNVFKERELVSVPRRDIVRSFTSSGTGGRQSRNHLDALSFSRVLAIAEAVYDGLGMVDRSRTVDYLLFSYDPEQAKDLGTSFTDDLLSSYTSIGERFFAIRKRGEDEEFRYEPAEVMETLLRYQKRGRPVRLLGFPAFIYLTLKEWIDGGNPPLKLGPDSWVMTGGGWKSLADHAVGKHEFIEAVSAWLGLPAGNVRDLFGMVEHGVPYVDCEAARLHVPIYSRVYIRDPESLALLPDGETGLIHFVTPYLHSYPAHAILTSDLGWLESGCPCGRPGRTLHVRGRGGVRKHRGCALVAAELLEGKDRGGRESA